MSSSHQRVVTGYLKPTQHSFIKKYIDVCQVSESQAINQAVKALQDAIPKEIKDRMIARASENNY